MNQIDLHRDNVYFGNVQTRSFRILNLAGGNAYPLVGRSGSLVIPHTILVVAVSLTSSINVGGVNCVGAAVGVDQGAEISMSGSANLWISHFHRPGAAAIDLVTTTREFIYPFCPKVDSSTRIVGYVTQVAAGADSYDGIATITYIPLTI